MCGGGDPSRHFLLSPRFCSEVTHASWENPALDFDEAFVGCRVLKPHKSTLCFLAPPFKLPEGGAVWGGAGGSCPAHPPGDPAGVLPGTTRCLGFYLQLPYVVHAERKYLFCSIRKGLFSIYLKDISNKITFKFC